jgi:hypothetical protein
MTSDLGKCLGIVKALCLALHLASAVKDSTDVWESHLAHRRFVFEFGQ